ncbi:hypothetical protein BGX27_003824, partial [Mortierella sp. AM989]
LLDQYTSEAGILEGKHGRYTTHCFRRGGAQHRFMFAKEKWSLKAIKWWGGWSEGEGVGTIMKYLLDEFVRYESGFGDMLSPARSDSRHSIFMGETTSSSGAEFVTQRSLAVSMETLRASLSNEANEVQRRSERSLDQKLSNLREDMSSSIALSNERLLQQIYHAIQLSATPAPSTSVTVVSTTTPQMESQASQQTQIQTQKQKQKKHQSGDDRAATLRIPDIATWKDAIRQWDNGELDKGLALPLKNWTTGMRRTDPSRYSQRKLIATEYIYLGRSDQNMRDIHGDSVDLVSSLIASIRSHNRERKKHSLGSGEGGSRRSDEDSEEEEVDHLIRRKRSAMDLHDVYRFALAALITAVLISFPLALAATIRLRAALPQHRPRNKVKRKSVSEADASKSISALSKPEEISTLNSRILPPESSTSILSTSIPKCTTTIFLGSGGHTAEMLQLISGLDISKYSPRHYVVGWDDNSSIEKLHRLEASRQQKDITIAIQDSKGAKGSNAVGHGDQLDGYTVHRIPRSRHVHQSMITTPFTLAKSLLVAMPLVKRLTCLPKQDFNLYSDSQSVSTTATPGSNRVHNRRSILLMNGPGTCFALALAVIGARILGVPDEQTPDLIFVESFARVKTLSLAGKLLYPLCDVFLVQWPGLKKR